ncbi:MAG TPA: EAL domain-containing protein [Candidatus Aquilonibacter sp.]|nr:EAL domain-containing protein [Candidatus Aquilonibacter sp.]
MTVTGNEGCAACRNATLPFEFSFAFQPIVEARSNAIVSYEALVRGPQGESAAAVLAQITPQTQYAFDQTARVRALTIAKRLGIATKININFLPNAMYRPETCIRSTVAAATELDIALDQIVFEVAEREYVADPEKLIAIFSEYKRRGMKTAIDDFGAGYAGLGLLARFQPDYIKLDMELIRNIHTDRVKQAIVRGVRSICSDLGIISVAEGVETRDESAWLLDAGIDLLQGYYFAKPVFEALPLISA